MFWGQILRGNRFFQLGLSPYRKNLWKQMLTGSSKVNKLPHLHVTLNLNWVNWNGQENKQTTLKKTLAIKH